MLTVGDAMPDLEVTDDAGDRHKLHDFLGKSLVLWFYPKDDTPG